MEHAIFMLCIALCGALMGHLSRCILLQALACKTALPGIHGRSCRGGEICGALLFMLIAYGAPSLNLPAALLFSWFLGTLSWIDYHLFLLPDRLTAPLLLCGLACRILLEESDGLYQGLLGAIAGGGVFWLLDTLFFHLRGYRGMGGGDGKLLAALGAWLGWQALPWLCCGAALCGLAVYALSGRRTGKIAFGPCLALAGWVIYISPINIIPIYTSP